MTVLYWWPTLPTKARYPTPMLGVEPRTSCMLSKPLSTEPHSQSFLFLNLPPIRANSDKLTHVCTSRGQGWRSVEVRCLYCSPPFLVQSHPPTPVLARLAVQDHLPLPPSTLPLELGLHLHAAPQGLYTHTGDPNAGLHACTANASPLSWLPASLPCLFCHHTLS